MNLKPALFTIFAFCFSQVSQANAFDDYVQMSQVYQKQLVEFLNYKSQFPAKHTTAKDSVKTAQEALTSAQAAKLATETQLKTLLSERDALPLRRAFLEKSILTAQTQISKYIAEAQSSPEFQNDPGLTYQKMQSRIAELNQLISNEQSQIASLQQQIRNIEAGSAYTQLINDRNSAQRRLDDVEIEERRLSQMISQVRSEAQMARNDAQRADQEAEELRRRKNDIVFWIPQLRRDIDRDRKEIRNNEQTIANHERELPGLDPQIAAAEMKMNDAQARAAAIQSELQQLQSQAQDLRRQIRETTDEKDRATLQAQLQVIEGQIQAKQGDLRAAQSEAKQYQGEVSRLRERKQDLQKAIQRLRRENRNLEDEIDRKERQIVDLEQEYRTIDRRIDQAEIEARRQWRRVEQLESEIARLEIDYSAVTRKLSLARQDLANAEDAIARYRQANIAPLESSIRAARSKIKSYEGRQATINVWIQKIDRQNLNIAEARKRAAAIAATEKSIDQTILQVRGELKRLEQAVLDQTLRLDQAQKALAALKTELQTKAADFSSLEKQLIDLKEKL